MSAADDTPSPKRPKRSGGAPAPIPRTGRFRPADRIRRSDDFALARAEGTRIDAGAIVVFVRPNESSRTRLGISIGRRFGTAVARNRVKRLLREAFRIERSALPSGIDLVILVRPHRARTLADYREMLRRAGR